MTRLALLCRTACLLSLGLVPLAQAEPRAAEERPEEGTPAGPSLVVVLDVAADATANSELRAALYGVARDLGYSPAGTLDVAAAAAAAGLVRGGVVTAAPDELERLREALGVQVLVRVSRPEGGPPGAARVDVVTRRGARGRGSAGSAEALGGALRRLLPARDPEPAPPPEAPSPARGAAFTGLLPAEVAGKAELPPHEAWERRGGARATYGAVVRAVATRLENQAFPARDPSGRPIEGRGDTNAVGGGAGVRVGVQVLPVPDPRLSSGSFVSFRAGIGADADVFWARAPAGYEYAGSTRSTRFESQAIWVASLPAAVGVAVAAGRFTGPTSWRGALIGFAYAPAAQFQMNLAESKGDLRVNPAGAELSVDVTQLEAREGVDAEMQLRIALSGLAPLGDDRPGLACLSLGAIWY